MKKVCNIFLVLIICIGAFTGCGGKKIDPNNISKEEFDKLSIGMTTSKVKEIVGSLGEKIGKSKEGNIVTTVYKIEGEKGGSAELTFQQDVSGGAMSSSSLKVKLTGMTQKDLK